MRSVMVCPLLVWTVGWVRKKGTVPGRGDGSWTSKATIGADEARV